MVMQAIMWDESLSVGIDEIDTDHKKLVNMSNELYVAAFAGVSDSILDGIADRLRTYTEEHFEREEKCMEDVDYPKLEDHRAQHRQLINQLNDFAARLKVEAKNDISGDMMVFLRDWIIVHICEYDLAYKPFLSDSESD